MTSEDSKTFSLTLSPTMIIGVLLATISAIGSGGYYGVTLYNRALSAIESVEGYQPYDDKELQSKVLTLETEMRAVKERQLSAADNLMKISEKLIDAVALARESQSTAASAVANSESVNREVQTRLAALKTELESTAAALKNEMAGLKKATSNPLGR
jgi:predicted  nucleic acid-binding Zn-ribbon protein